MTSAKPKSKQLESFLATLPAGTAQQLLSAIERDEAASRELDRDGVITSALRALLADGGAESSADTDPETRADIDAWPVPDEPPLEFLTPIEDFLVDETVAEKQIGRIARGSAAKIWTWLCHELARDELPKHARRLEIAHKAADAEGAAEAGRALLDESAAALARCFDEVEPHSAAYLRLAGHLGGANVLEDAREIMRMFRLAPAIADVQKRLPVRISRLDEQNLDDYAKIYKNFAAENDGYGWVALLTIMGRMIEPATIVDLVIKLVGSKSDIDIRAEEPGIACDVALHDMEITVLNAARLIRAQSDIDTVFAEIKKFHGIAETISNGLEIDRKGPWGNRLVRVRDMLADAIHRQIADAPRRVKAALFCGFRAPSGGVEQGNLVTKGPDEVDVTAAEYTVRLLFGVKPYLAQLPINAEYVKLSSQVLQFVERIGDATVDRVRNADPAEKPALEAFLKANILITRIVFGEDAASLMRRQGHIAARPAAAEAVAAEG